jgi:5-methylcytosine-specific restriction endonuclease McrBC regulatory subunit McrC
VIRLVEYSTTQAPLAEADLDYLLDLVTASGQDDEAKLLQAVTPTRQRGVYALRSGPYVGRLGLPSGGWIDFVSRFSFEDVLELIRRSGRLPIRQDSLPIATEQADALVDVIAAAFLRETARIVGGGLAKGYTERRFEQPPYPGTLHVRQHLSRFAARPDRLVTVASRLTRDIPVNQALAGALEVLRRVPLRREVSAGIAGMALAFREVRRVPMTADAVARIRLTALTKGYREALALAGLILSSQSLIPQGQAYAGASIVFSMPRVWETYVAHCVREAWPDAFEVTSPFPFDLTPAGGLPAEADVVVRGDGKLVALYDAKYKWLDKAPTRGDIYQMVTYCERLGLGEATLVYPGSPGARSIDVGNRQIHVVGLSEPTRSNEAAGYLRREVTADLPLA